MKKRFAHKGFSLIEISIVLLIISVAIGSGLMVFNKYSSQSKIEQTEIIMRQVMTVLKKYVQKYGELPCPADPTLKNSDKNFGFGIFDGGKCSGTIGIGSLSKGMVPVHTLGIYPSLAMDAWGNRLDYIILLNDVNPEALSAYDDNAISVRNYGDGTQYSHIKVVLMSRGENGYCAYSGKGGETPKAFSGTNPNEQTNCGTDERYYISTPYKGFDDILFIWSYEQLESPLME